MSNTLKHVTLYYDADWAADPVTRKSTSCTLCYVDPCLLTSECRGQGTVALSSGDSELYALGSQSAELIFAQAILNEIGILFLIHARAGSSTARVVATKQGASRKMKQIHTRFLFIQDLVFRKLLVMSAVRTEVNPSDTGTQALDMSDSTDCDRCLVWGQSSLRRVHLATGTMETSDKLSYKQNVWRSGRVERSTRLNKR